MAAVGRRSRKRAAAGEALPALEAPEERYEDPEHGELVLRAVMTPRTRQAYGRLLEEARAAATREDVHHRRTEFLFERLAVRWTIGGVPAEGEKALLVRWRAASPAERAFVREAVRRHCAEWFPDVEAP